MDWPIKDKPRRDRRTVVFVTFETSLAPAGGLAAVMAKLPAAMARDERCCVIAPFFRAITERRRPHLLARIRPTGVQATVEFAGAAHRVEVLDLRPGDGFPIYLLAAEGFFDAPCAEGEAFDPTAPCNPYAYPSEPGRLLENALFFCAAVPRALAALGHTQDLVLSLQDWEAAAVALTVRQEPAIRSAACLLTLHNPYDQLLPDEALRRVYAGSPADLPGHTVLDRLIPLLDDGPLYTVSETFARELTTDPLHTQVYAPHLQGLLRARTIHGIDNGIFVTPNFPPAAIEAARQTDAAHRNDLAPLLAEKRRRRAALVTVLTEYQPAGAWGHLGDLADFAGPIFLMFGRDDPRQKGYDVLAAAVRHIPPDQAKFVLTSIPGEEGLAGLRFLADLARQRPGQVKVFPLRVERGYQELQAGCSFLVMPSLYEPFGGATEGYAVGTPVLARATGGLIQQVAPSSGLLFRESDALPAEMVVQGWREIVACRHWDSTHRRPVHDRVAARADVPLFQAMTAALVQALQQAIAIYDEPGQRTYAGLILGGFEMLDRFTWERAVLEYEHAYDRLCV